jgi:hypothetical protein
MPACLRTRTRTSHAMGDAYRRTSIPPRGVRAHARPAGEEQVKALHTARMHAGCHASSAPAAST